MNLRTKTKKGPCTPQALRVLSACLCLFLVCALHLHAQEAVYERVKTTEQLVVGDKYIFVCAPQGKAMGYQKENNRQAVNIMMENGKNYIVGIPIATRMEETNKIYEFTLGGEPGKYTFYDDLYGGFLYASGNGSGKNYLNTGNPLRDSYKTASITKGKKGTTLTFAPKETNKNYKISNNILSIFANCFACYQAAHDSISLYRKVKNLGLLSISKYGFTTYTSQDCNYEMPQGCTGYAVTLENDELKLTERYKSGDAVPARTPLMIQGGEGTYSIYETTRKVTTPLLEDENLLHSEFDAEGKVAYDIEHADDHYYYKLTTKNGTNFGFYWGAANGGPFKMKSLERAYLVLPQFGNEVKGLALDDAQMETDVTLPQRERLQDHRTYDLFGRSRQGQLVPGIYVHEGRKIMVRQ